MTRNLTRLGCLALSLGTGLIGAQQTRAGTFQSDFNTGIPAGMNLLGNAVDYDMTSGGVNNSGVLKLTENTGSQQGTAIIDDFDAGAIIGGFDATFQLYIGSGNGADGFSFAFGDFGDAAWGEEGPGTINGLSISFDVYNNGGAVAEAPAIDLKWNGVTFAHRLVGAASTTTGAQPIGSATTVRTQPTANGAPVYWPVKIHVDTDGTLDLAYNNVVVYTNFPIFRPITEFTLGPAARFGFGARTGGSYDAHWVDDLKITTVPVDASSGQPYLKSLSQVPVGSNGSAAGGITLEFQDGPASINTNSLVMKLNNNTVTPTVTRDTDVTRIAYLGANGLLPTGVNTVQLSYVTTSGTPATNSFSFSFAVDPAISIPASYAVTGVDKTKPGFKVRAMQLDGAIRGPGDGNFIIAAERHLANGYIDPTTGQPYANVADTSLAGTDGYIDVPGVINWNYQAPTGIGNFTDASTPSRPDEPIPGLPGTVGSTDNAAFEIQTFLELKAGAYRFGFNSDDGFRASFGPGFDAAGTTIVGSFNGGRGSADTLFDVVVPQDGVYPLRLSYWQGGGGANAELFYIDSATGQKVLVNDPEILTAPRAYREATASRPSITRVLPVQNWIAAAADQDVIIDITDGALALDPNTVAVKINGVDQTVTKNKSGKVTTIRRAGSLTNLLPPGNNNVTLVYGFNQSGTPVTVTNNYTFNVAPYYGVLSPAVRVPADSVSGSGFSARVEQLDRSLDAVAGNGGRINGNGDGNRMPAPEIAINNGEIDPKTGQPYPNLAAKGLNGDWTYNFDLFNFNAPSQLDPSITIQPDTGLFEAAAPAAPFVGANADMVMPGLPGAGTSPAASAAPTTGTIAPGSENYVMEATTYLDLKKGVYVFGVNSDDGFVLNSGANPNDTLGTLVGFADYGRGNSGNNLAIGTVPAGQAYPQISPGTNSGTYNFSVIVPEDGIYPFRLLYWQGGGGVNAEFYTLDKQNGQVLLVNDVNASPSAVRAYSTSSAVAGKPWVRSSVSPTPWDNVQQQAGPGPLRMYGRTANNVNSSDIYNISAGTTSTTLPGAPQVGTTRPWADVAIGGVVANGVGDSTLGLLLDGARVAATMVTNGTDVTVSYRPNPPLPSGSKHVAALTYAGTTNSWPFVVQSYTNLNASDKQPSGAADQTARGFRVKVAQNASVPAGVIQNSVARAEAALAGTVGVPDVALPGPAEGGAYIYTNIINWNNNVNPNRTGVQIGNFQNNTYGAGWPFPSYPDEPIPGVPGTGVANNFTDNVAAEVFAYLDFPAAGYYRLGVNSDDGFALRVGTPGQTNGTVIASYDVGKGASDVPVSFTVPEAGLYPFRLVYYNGGGGGALEYFSYDDNGNKIPINDQNNPNAIKAYYKLGSGSGQPVLTVSRGTDGNVNITWTGGGTLQSSPVLGTAATWTDINSSGSYSTAPNGTQFFRVRQ